MAVARGAIGNHDRGVTGSEAPRRLPTSAKYNLAALVILAGALVVQLWPDWTQDPDLSHGLLMPVVCVLLVYLCRQPEVAVDEGRATALAVAFGACSLAALWVAGLLAVTVEWSSAVVSFALAVSFALLGCAALSAFAGGATALVSLNWTSLCAAFLWVLTAPMPPGTYTRLTLGLQLEVTRNVMRALDLLGIAAHRSGNIIELAHGTVGIEEACSGVRSLISCVFAGLLFSAALVRRTWARVLLVALSAPLALVMNFLRSLFLTLLVNSGARVAGAWHDLTGYAVLLVTAALLVGLALLLDGPGATQPDPVTPPSPVRTRPARAQAVLSGVLVVAVSTLLFFASHTSASPGSGMVPDLLAALPPSADGWQVVTRGDLYRFAGVLRTDHLVERTYFRQGASGAEQVTLYLAYWPAGQASAGVVGSHTPDACWPGAGWVEKDVPDDHVLLGLAGQTLPAAKQRFFVNEGFPQYVWFWQAFGGRVVDVGNTRSVSALVRIALQYGFRKGSAQAFIRVSSNQPWDKISGEPFLGQFFANTRRLGLY